MVKKKENKEPEKEKNLVEKELELLKEELLKEEPGYQWYFLNVLSTQEEVVKERIERYVKENHLENDVLAVMLPEVTVYTIEKGKKQESRKKLYPGYLLIKMKTIYNIENEDDKNLSLWYKIRSINGVIDFVGLKNGHIPIPVSKKELLKIFESKKEQTRVYEYRIGDKVKIINGPFSDFIGDIEEVDDKKLQLTVVVSVFGRETPIQIGFDDVEKL